MTRCARCNWRPDGDETLEQHALVAGHPLCIGRHDRPRSLPPDRPQVCRSCQDRSTEHLDDILELWHELPDQLEHHASARLPGGDALALLAGGSHGTQRRVARQVRRSDPDERTQLVMQALDNAAQDVPSVAWTLCSWEDDWRHTRGDPAAALPASATATVLQAAHTYLREHSAWAAAEHPAWDSYDGDLAQLHVRLLRATGRLREPTRLDVLCLACRGRLVRPIVTEREAVPADPAPQWWLGRGRFGPVTLEQWNAALLGTAGLEHDDAVCRDCGTWYTPGALLLAQQEAHRSAQWLTDADGTWGTDQVVADALGRPRATVRWWRHRGVVRSQTDGTLTYAHLGDAQAWAAARSPRGAPTASGQ